MQGRCLPMAAESMPSSRSASRVLAAAGLRSGRLLALLQDIQCGAFPALVPQLDDVEQRLGRLTCSSTTRDCSRAATTLYQAEAYRGRRLGGVGRRPRSAASLWLAIVIV